MAGRGLTTVYGPILGAEIGAVAAGSRTLGSRSGIKHDSRVIAILGVADAGVLPADGWP